MSTHDIFSHFKEYLPAHIEWLDDTSCNVVWLDEMTATRALINMSSLPALDKIRSRDASEDKSSEKSKKDKQEDSSDDDEAEEGEVEDENSSDVELDTLSQVEEESLLRNDLRPANKLAKGSRLFMRFATKGLFGGVRSLHDYVHDFTCIISLPADKEGEDISVPVFYVS